MFEQTFKNIDDVLWKEAGCATELDYTEQTSWILFLKYLDDLERANEQKAELSGKKYEPIIDKSHRWSVWAAPKKKDGSFDHDRALTGDDLIKYVDEKLFPYLKGFRTRAEGANTIEYKIGEIFSEIENKFRSGYSLRDALELVDQLSFRSQQEKHELSHLYEAKLRNMGNAGRNGGEYYTPRPLIRAMIQVVKPQVGERIYDGACGSAGFLCEAFDYLTRERDKLSTKDLNTLQTRTFYAKEKKSLAYVIGIMNMILHGIEAPNIVHTNTLAENISDIQDKDRFDVVLANPPFGGKERPEVQQNFPIKTGETAYLFLQHFIKSLKAGGRAGVIIKNTFLSNTDNASVALRKELLENCNLHTVLDMPGGTFQGAGVKTVVLFFEKGAPTRKVWFYKPDVGRSLGKTNPLNDDDLKDFVLLQATFKDSDNSWTIDAKSIDKTTYDLSVKNPNKADETKLRDPKDIVAEMVALDAESSEILTDIGALDSALSQICVQGDKWPTELLSSLIISGRKIAYGVLKPGKHDASGVRVIKSQQVRDGWIDLTEDFRISRELDQEFSRTRLEGGEVLLNVVGSIGRSAVAPDEVRGANVTRAIAVIPVRRELSEWVQYSLQAHVIQQLMRSHIGGVAQPVLNLGDVKVLPIPMPPREVREKIVKCLDAARASANRLEVAYERRAKALASLRQSILQKALGGELTSPPSQAIKEAAE